MVFLNADLPFFCLSIILYAISKLKRYTVYFGDILRKKKSESYSSRQWYLAHTSWYLSISPLNILSRVFTPCRNYCRVTLSLDDRLVGCSWFLLPALMTTRSYRSLVSLSTFVLWGFFPELSFFWTVVQILLWGVSCLFFFCDDFCFVFLIHFPEKKLHTSPFTLFLQFSGIWSFDNFRENVIVILHIFSTNLFWLFSTKSEFLLAFTLPVCSHVVCF